jgi:hypothetical protein
MFELFLSFDSYGRLDFRIKMISHQTKRRENFFPIMNKLIFSLLLIRDQEWKYRKIIDNFRIIESQIFT